MLVLSRQRDETIMIGDNVEITIVDIRGDKVRIGINAPREIQVHRKEVYDAIKRENQEAAKLSAQDVSDFPERSAQEKKPEPKDESGEGRGESGKGLADDSSGNQPKRSSRANGSR